MTSPAQEEEPAPGILQDCVVILAPRGRDAAVAAELLECEVAQTLTVETPEALAGLVAEGPGTVLVTEEALVGPGAAHLQQALATQPAWSDLPVVVLANGAAGTRTAQARERIDGLGNVVLLSRPLHSEELVRAVRSALKARRRQHEARERMQLLEQREREVRESEAKLHAIANSVDQMIWSTRPDGYHDYFNDRWYEFTGVPRGSTDGEAWNGMFHPEDRERAWEIWRHSLQTGEPYEIEYRLRAADGAYRWVLGRAIAVRDCAGRIIRWYGSCTDIHEEVVARTAAVADLTRQRDRAWDLSLDLMAVADHDGVVTVLNQAWTRIFWLADRGIAWPQNNRAGPSRRSDRRNPGLRCHSHDAPGRTLRVPLAAPRRKLPLVCLDGVRAPGADLRRRSRCQRPPKTG